MVWHLAEHELSLKPQHPVAEPRQASIAPRISGGAASVVSTVDFEDEPSASANEVTDVACERDLTPEGRAQLSIDERGPEQAFWWRAVSGRIDIVRLRKADTVEIQGDFRADIVIRDQRGRNRWVC